MRESPLPSTLSLGLLLLLGGCSTSPGDGGPRGDGGTGTPDGAAGSDAGPGDGGPRGDGGASHPDGSLCDRMEICGNGLDEDCDGRADQGCACTAGTTQPCYDGPRQRAGVGACTMGSQSCQETPGSEFATWGPCEGEAAPSVEVCEGMLDEDCDGDVDEGCECTAGSSRACYGGPAGTSGVGICHDGMQSCVAGPGAASTTWGPCMDEVLPEAELCDGVDRSCTGSAGCACILGATRACYGGPAGTSGVGICHDGMQSCVAGPGAASTTWGPCMDEVLPEAELCDGVDRSCTGSAGCACVLGATRACYGGPAGTSGVGVCHDGMQSCAATPGGVAWSGCAGEQLPAAEICGNTMDDDCNGVTDEGCPPVLPAIRCSTPCVNAQRLDTTASFDPAAPRWSPILLFEPSMTATVQLTTSDTTGVVFDCRQDGVPLPCAGSFPYAAGSAEGVHRVTVQARRSGWLVMDTSFELAVYGRVFSGAPSLPGGVGGSYMLRTTVPTQTSQEPDHVWVAGGATLLIHGRNFCYSPGHGGCMIVGVGGAIINVSGSNISTGSVGSDFVVDTAAALVMRGSNFFPDSLAVGLDAIVIRSGSNFRTMLSRLATPGLDVMTCPFSRTGGCPPGLVYVD